MHQVCIGRGTRAYLRAFSRAAERGFRWACYLVLGSVPESGTATCKIILCEKVRWREHMSLEWRLVSQGFPLWLMTAVFEHFKGTQEHRSRCYRWFMPGQNEHLAISTNACMSAW